MSFHKGFLFRPKLIKRFDKYGNHKNSWAVRFCLHPNGPYFFSEKRYATKKLAIKHCEKLQRFLDLQP